MAETHIIQAQTALAAGDFYKGRIDGDFGENSLKAVLLVLDNAEKAVSALNKTEDSAPTVDSGFKLSLKSLDKLNGVHPDLIKVVHRAIKLTTTDFMVNEGLRTKERQAQLVKSGASQTMNSNHLTGNAVDIVPIVNGKADFANWDNYYPLAKAMTQAATELGVNVRWGGMWARINGKQGEPKQWVSDYVSARRKLGKSAFIDGPHFELG